MGERQKVGENMGGMGKVGLNFLCCLSGLGLRLPARMDCGGEGGGGWGLQSTLSPGSLITVVEGSRMVQPHSWWWWGREREWEGMGEEREEGRAWWYRGWVWERSHTELCSLDRCNQVCDRC